MNVQGLHNPMIPHVFTLAPSSLPLVISLRWGVGGETMLSTHFNDTAASLEATMGKKRRDSR